jgi:cyclophilin family peptidyl-prolyl cis-trans isomerase
MGVWFAWAQPRSLLAAGCCLTLTTLLLASPLVAEDSPKPPTEPPKVGEKANGEKANAEKAADAKVGDNQAAGDFAAEFDQWKNLLKDLRKLRLQHATASEVQKPQYEAQWDALLAKGQEMLPKLRDAGLKSYQAAPNVDPQLARFLVKLAADAIELDDYETAAAIGSALIENGSSDRQIYDSAGIAAYVMSDFDKAEKYFKIASEAGVLSQLGTECSHNVPEQRELWQKEAEILAQEAKANDLPRVKLETNKGTIVLELFENEAPETVGNFVSLVEKGFYDGVGFHRVLKNFMAQGGDPKGDGSGGPGYHIFCECYKPDYRRHFRGALSMAHAGRDTGGSQFFITFLPTPSLNGKHTCFGRVIEGMEVLTKLQRRDPTASPPLPEPDKIIKAEVVRKRDHAYAPHKVD